MFYALSVYKDSIKAAKHHAELSGGDDGSASFMETKVQTYMDGINRVVPIWLMLELECVIKSHDTEWATFKRLKQKFEGN